MRMFYRLTLVFAFVSIFTGNVSAQTTCSPDQLTAVEKTAGKGRVWHISTLNALPLLKTPEQPKDNLGVQDSVLGTTNTAKKVNAAIDRGFKGLDLKLLALMKEQIEAGNIHRTEVRCGDKLEFMASGNNSVLRDVSMGFGLGATVVRAGGYEFGFFDGCWNCFLRKLPPAPPSPAPEPRVRATPPQAAPTPQPAPVEPDIPRVPLAPPPPAPPARATPPAPTPGSLPVVFTAGFETNYAHVQKLYPQGNHGFKNESTDSANTLLTARLYAPKPKVFLEYRGTVPVLHRVGTWSLVDKNNVTVRGNYDRINGDGQQEYLITGGYQSGLFHATVGLWKHDWVQDYNWTAVLPDGTKIPVHEVHHLKHTGIVLGGGVQADGPKHLAFQAEALWAPSLNRTSTTAQNDNDFRDFPDAKTDSGMGVKARASVTAYVWHGRIGISGGYELNSLRGSRPFAVTPGTTESFPENLFSNAGFGNVTINVGRKH